MKKIILPLLCSVALVWTSCGGSKSNDGKNDSTASTDSLALSPELKVLSAKFKDAGSLPYKTDSVMISKITGSGDSLSADEVKMLAVNWHKDENLWVPAFEDFYLVDSVKDHHGFKNYCDSLEIGMTRDANAYALGKVTLDPHTFVLVWGIWTTSVEACPMSDNRSVCCTIVHDGKPTESFLFGRTLSEADAPVWMNEVILGQLDKDGNISIDSHSQSADGAELTKEHAKITAKISDGKITALNVSKDKPQTEKYSPEADD